MYLWHCWSFAPFVSKRHRASAVSTQPLSCASLPSQITLYVLGKRAPKPIWADLAKTESVQAMKLLGWDTRKQVGSKTVSTGAPLGSSVYVRVQAAFQLGVQSGKGSQRQLLLSPPSFRKNIKDVFQNMFSIRAWATDMHWLSLPKPMYSH